MLKQKSIQRNILIITLVLLIPFVFYIIQNRHLTLQLIKSYKDWDYKVLEYFVPIIFLPIGLFYFFKQKKIGWIIVNSLLVYFLLSTIYLMILEIRWGILKINDEFHYAIFNNILPREGMALYIIQIILLLSILIYIGTNNVKDKYSISKTIQLLSLILPALLVFFYILIN